jgi:hypothetical protein
LASAPNRLRSCVAVEDETPGSRARFALDGLGCGKNVLNLRDDGAVSWIRHNDPCDICERHDCPSAYEVESQVVSLVGRHEEVRVEEERGVLSITWVA